MARIYATGAWLQKTDPVAAVVVPIWVRSPPARAILGDVARRHLNRTSLAQMLADNQARDMNPLGEEPGSRAAGHLHHELSLAHAGVVA